MTIKRLSLVDYHPGKSFFRQNFCFVRNTFKFHLSSECQFVRSEWSDIFLFLFFRCMTLVISCGSYHTVLHKHRRNPIYKKVFKVCYVTLAELQCSTEEPCLFLFDLFFRLINIGSPTASATVNTLSKETRFQSALYDCYIFFIHALLNI